MERLNQTGAGLLEQKVAFDKRAMVDDGYGNEVSGDWVEQFQARAQFMFMRGSEQVMAARLDSREPMLVRIRMSAAAREIGNDWQMRDMHGGGKPYNVRDITWDNNRAVVDILVALPMAPLDQVLTPSFALSMLTALAGSLVGGAMAARAIPRAA